MSLTLKAILILAVVFSPASHCAAGLTRHDVLVIANSNSPASIATAAYYAQARNIPASHIKQISCSTGDVFSVNEYEAFRAQVQTHLVALGAVASDPANDPVKCILLTPDIPHKISDGEAYASVDSALATMFSDAPWGRGPFGVYGRFQPTPASYNPYYGDDSPYRAFSAFRADASAAAVREAFPTPGFTLVRMLDSDTAIAAGGGGVICRGVRVGSVWTWTPLAGKDKGGIGWKVTGFSAISPTNLFICTGGLTKPHGGGSVLKSTDGGATWSYMYRSTRINLFKNIYAWAALDFADPLVGVAAGSKQTYNAARQPVLLKTSNGGVGISGWTEVSTLPAGFFPKGIAVVDSQNYWICGNGGKIYRTTDGGATWSLANTGATAVDYNAIWIKQSAGAYRGWAAGDAGVIIRTEDGSNWTREASGLTTYDITDLAVIDQDHACASYGQASFLSYVRGVGWTKKTMSSASVASASVPAAGYGVAVGGNRNIFCDSSSGWAVRYTGRENTWYIRYLVNRLGGYAADISPADGIPDDVKAIIDRGVNAVSSSGKWIFDEAVNYGGSIVTPNFYETAYDNLLPVVGSANITWDKTSAFLMNQSNVLGWTFRGLGDSDVENQSPWGRPVNNWQNGGIGTVYESTDGRSIEMPWFIWSCSSGGTKYAGKLTLYFLVKASYNGYRVVLHSHDGSELASGTIASGLCQINLSAVAWPANFQTYMQVYFPSADPLHPNEPIYNARYPWSGSNSEIYNNRVDGFSINTSMARSLMSELLHEGATGGIANAEEPWSNYCGQPHHLFPAYAKGYTWAEAAYMGLPGLGWQEVVLGDPLMAPCATPPAVDITEPAQDGYTASGTLHVTATAQGVGGPGIAKVEFRLDDDTLLESDTSAPYDVDTATGSLSNGIHTVEAIAYENDSVQNTASVIRYFIVDNGGFFDNGVIDALWKEDDRNVALSMKVVTAAFNGFFYIGEPGKLHGIRVRADKPVTLGAYVTVIGKMTTRDGEREILADYVFPQ